MRSATYQQTIRCPNCGSEAERRYFTSNQEVYRTCPSNQVIQTECAVCDYLMVMCSLNGSVIEAQAPGTWVPTHSSQDNSISAMAVKDNWAMPLLN